MKLLVGKKTVKVYKEGEKVIEVVVDMGEFQLDNLTYIIEFDNMQYKVHPILVGNPHAVCFVKDLENFDVEKVGRYLENYKYFPNKTNVEFVEVIDKKNIKVRVWERGVGETNSCGTGSCASALIAIHEKYTDNQLTVELKGGKLEINYDKIQDKLELIGPAEIVFEGEIEMM